MLVPHMDLTPNALWILCPFTPVPPGPRKHVTRQPQPLRAYGLWAFRSLAAVLDHLVRQHFPQEARQFDGDHLMSLRIVVAVLP